MNSEINNTHGANRPPSNASLTKIASNLAMGSALMAISLAASSQETLFEEDFSAGAGQFSTQGSTYTTGGTARLRGGANDGRMDSNVIDASGYSDLSLSFDRTTSGLDFGESGRVSVSINGGSFTVLESLRRASGRTTLQLGSSADNSSIQIRYQTFASSFYEIYTIDNIVIEGNNDSPPPPPPTGDLAAIGAYLETGGTATTPDQFSFTNTGDINIDSLTIDLSGGNASPVFDPNGVSFTVTGSDNVGFSGNFGLSSSSLLTLNFIDFGPGETFSFSGDLDDSNGSYTTGADVMGAELTVSASGNPSVSASFTVDSSNADRAVVNIGGSTPPPPIGGGCGPDPTVASLEASTGPFSFSNIDVPSSAQGFRNGTIYYPTNAPSDCTFGVISVVPGFLANESSIDWWGPRLASHGFIVITINTNTITDQPNSRALQSIAALNYAVNLGNSSSSAIGGKVDSSKQGVMGWSMGGGGALRAAADNPYLKAAMPQAPFNSGPNDFDEITLPTLIIACENDTVASVGIHASPFYNAISSTTEKGFLEINNGNHSCANGGSNRDILGKYGVSWMKRFMDDDTRYSQFLCDVNHTSDSAISDYRENCPY